MKTKESFSTGNVIRARGRDWVVLAGSDQKRLRIRPLIGSESDAIFLIPDLEPEPVAPSQFAMPTPELIGNHRSAALFRDAVLLTLGSGAGAFRSFGRFSFEPRPYQLVPLLMAMKQDPVRLLIADDVGIGKTIEAGMIAREWLERGEIERLSVIAPPHLVEQWRQELEEKFHLQGVVVNSKTAPRLEAALPPGKSLFEMHSITVVSLDFMKSERRRDDFALRCPEFVIVDEAHTAASSQGDGQLRQALLRKLAEKEDRSIILLTATPHSGDEQAFANLLAMLNPRFANWNENEESVRKKMREKLAEHFVQRRRADVKEFSGGAFAIRESSELAYQMTGEYWNLFQSILTLYSTAENLHIWTALSLLRSATSSPAALISSLRASIEGKESSDEEERLRVTEGGIDFIDDDLEGRTPAEMQTMKDLLSSAEALTPQQDPKLQSFLKALKPLVNEGFRPVIFCRFISTAKYIGEILRAEYKKSEVAVVTGELGADERRGKIVELERLRQEDRHVILVATDCLSEGINLQRVFNSVIHYDLSWNPMRHEQREGRVDRFGQSSKVVRTLLLYGENNPADELMLKVIIRKAKRIQQELGVQVPVPELEQDFFKGLLDFIKKGSETDGSQQELVFADIDPVKKIDIDWETRKEEEKKTRTIFAQRTIRPEEAVREWEAATRFLGNGKDVDRFLNRAFTTLGVNLDEKRFVDPKLLPEHFRNRLVEAGIEKPFRFTSEIQGSGIYVTRSHPIVQTVAGSLKDDTLENADDSPGNLGRAGCWVSPAAETETLVLLLRIRYELIEKGKRPVVVEESVTTAVAKKNSEWTQWSEDGLPFLAEEPSGRLSENARTDRLTAALKALPALESDLNAIAKVRAERLLEDHTRLRQNIKAKGKPEVKHLAPLDILGAYLILPQ